MLSGEETQDTAASRAPGRQLTLQASSRVFRPCLPAANALRPLRRWCAPERRIAPVPPLSPRAPMGGRGYCAKMRSGLGSRTLAPGCHHVRSGLACRVISIVSHFAQCSNLDCSQKGRSDRARWWRQMRWVCAHRPSPGPSFLVSPPASACVLLASPWLATCRGLSATSNLGAMARFRRGPLEELGN
jgi:hypothetical protein